MIFARFDKKHRESESACSQPPPTYTPSPLQAETHARTHAHLQPLPPCFLPPQHPPAPSILHAPHPTPTLTPTLLPPGCGKRQPGWRECRGELDASRQFDFFVSLASYSSTESRSKRRRRWEQTEGEADEGCEVQDRGGTTEQVLRLKQKDTKRGSEPSRGEVECVSGRKTMEEAIQAAT